MLDANAAYSKEYEIRQSKGEIYFGNNNLIKETNKQISDQYLLITKIYDINKTGLFVSYNQIVDQHNKMIYDYKCLYESAFFSLIHHRDGHEYFIFKRDLYGYSVLDLSKQNDFHYFPECVLKNEEAFIWTSIYYNRMNNILAARGCFWGSCYDVALIDFSKPMEMPKNQILVSECLSHLNTDVNFISWVDTDLHLEIECEYGERAKKTIGETEYLNWLFSK